VFLRPRDLREEDECDHENEAKMTTTTKRARELTTNRPRFHRFKAFDFVCFNHPRVEETCEESTKGTFVLLQKNTRV
jgi:hypothetical protein